MVNEGIDNTKSRNSKKVSDTKKSKKCYDHSKYKTIIPTSWVKYMHDEIKKILLLGSNNLIDEIKDGKPNLQYNIENTTIKDIGDSNKLLNESMTYNNQ